ncbi:MAG: hypothetical protein JSS65_07465 [Armatimonadetes bacterium]|nr:hypothetical protein [Armatimonadota bacterium]
MTQAPKLWIPIVATIIFGGVAATTWSWVTAGDAEIGKPIDLASQRKATEAKRITPSEVTDPLVDVGAAPGGASMTCDDKYVYIYSGSKLMKVDKQTLQIVSSANLIPKSTPNIKVASYQGAGLFEPVSS